MIFRNHSSAPSSSESSLANVLLYNHMQTCFRKRKRAADYRCPPDGARWNVNEQLFKMWVEPGERLEEKGGFDKAEVYGFNMCRRCTE